MAVVLLLHAAATLLMAGVAWFVQLVHYPLFAAVGPTSYPAYADEHQRRTTWLVAPLMAAEAGTALVLLIGRPTGVAAALPWAGAAALAVVWASTALLQVPRHKILSGGWDATAARGLVTTSYLRTAAWTARAGLVLAMLAQATR